MTDKSSMIVIGKGFFLTRTIESATISSVIQTLWLGNNYKIVNFKFALLIERIIHISGLVIKVKWYTKAFFFLQMSWYAITSTKNEK